MYTLLYVYVSASKVENNRHVCSKTLKYPTLLFTDIVFQFCNTDFDQSMSDNLLQMVLYVRKTETSVNTA